MGGVVGGVAVLGVLAGSTYYFRFKTSKPSSPSNNIGTAGEMGGGGPHELWPLPSEPKPESEKELPTEAQATEMYVPPGELASNNDVWELDTAISGTVAVRDGEGESIEASKKP